MGTADWMAETCAIHPTGTSSTDFNSTGDPCQWINVINGYVKGVYCTFMSDLGQSAQYDMLPAADSGQAFVVQVFDILESLYEHESTD